ncbi:hypothetical protein [Halochromatium glycolicum]|uniref:hypothetical protein n=1 Tax=Halochromatium glycolicum TaxID=85075 RepID=UPI001A9149D5|nr:hypothetical protein [Halochromatium glycolicum]
MSCQSAYAEVSGNDDRNPELDLLQQVQPRYASGLSQRRPLQERELEEWGGRISAPPRQKFTGFEPRIGLGFEYTDNLSFSNTEQEDDVIALLSPGFNYVANSPQWRVGLDYGFEAAAYRDNTELDRLLDAQTVSLSATYNASPLFGITVSELFQQTHDPTAEALVTAASPATRFTTNILSTLATLRPNRTSDVNLGVSHQLLLTSDDDGADAQAYAFDAQARWLLGRAARLTARYNAQYLRFDLPPATLSSAAANARDDHGIIQGLRVGYQRALARNLAADIELGFLEPGPFADEDWQGRAQLRAATTNQLATLDASRDTTVVAGIGAPLLRNRLAFDVENRPFAGLRVGGTIALTRFKTLDREPQEFDTIDIGVAVRYALGSNIWLEGLLNRRQQEVSGDTTHANSLTFSIVKGL